MQEIVKATKVLLLTKKYRIWFALITVITFVVLASAPVFLIPGNSFGFQASIYTPRDWILLIVISPLNALLILMQIKVFKDSKAQKEKLKAAGGAGISGYSAFVASILATASCASCVAGLFGFLGVGGVLFITEYRWLFVLGALLIIAVALYFTSRRYNNNCGTCTI